MARVADPATVVVPGEGPIPCDLMFIGEAPGRDEVRSWPNPRPFVGKAGRELERYLDGDTLPKREEVYITNVSKTLPIKKTPSPEEIARWRKDLEDEIAVVRPKVIVALGATALKWFSSSASVERTHGLQVSTYRDAAVFGAYHPAATLHSPELQSHFAGDMEALSLGLRSGFPGTRVDKVDECYDQLLRSTTIPAAFSIDTEGSARRPWCLTLSWEAGKAFIVQAGRRDLLAKVQAAVRAASRVTCQGLLHDLDVLDALGVTIPEAAYDDTQIMAYLLCLEPQGLKDLAYRHLGAEQEDYDDVIREADQRLVTAWLEDQAAGARNDRTFKALLRVLSKITKDGRPARKIWTSSKFSKALDPPPAPTLDDVPPFRAIRYACRDADLTERLRPILWQKIQERKLERVYKLDLSVLPIVNRMQHVGMRVLPEHFRMLVAQLDQELVANREAIKRSIGCEINPTSGPQVAKLLFEELKLPSGKRTRSGDRFSTEDKFLEALRSRHAVVPLIIDGREIVKLKSTYAGAILNLAREENDGEWFIYPHLRITRVVSGRVSAFDPNVLAIPKHSKRGRLIRLGFVAGRDRVLLSTDLSQIELRVAAHECKDPRMLKAFKKGQDIHAALGEKIFGIKAEDQEESKHRLPMKKANFGYWMGISAAGMRDQLHAAGATTWSVEDCQKIIDEYDRIWPKAREYKMDKVAEARRYGYVTDLLGQRRYLAGVHSPDRWIQLEAERQAVATPIQSGAQKVFKTWMAAVWRGVICREHRLRPRVYLEPWLQVHDDLLVEVSRIAAPRISERILACIPQMLLVPVTAKVKSAESWGEIQED